MLAAMDGFTRAGSGVGQRSSSADRGIGLNSAPRRIEGPVAPARVQNRLRELQALCTRDCEALLFVAGVDGKYNEGARKALNFLLYGCSGHEVTSSKSDADLADGLLVVSATTCFLHLGSSDAYWKLLPVLGPVADLQLSAPTPEEEKDLDLLEERKILCFLEAISDFKTVGVELSHGDAMELEKWPLIQVYGIEELGVRGFFTMRHKVVDVGPALQKIYMQLDAHAAQTVITYNVDLLAFHWLTSLAILDKTRVRDRMRLTEAALIEPLASFFSYGTLRASDVQERQRYKPRAVFGVRTNLEDGGAGTSAAATVKDTGVAGQPAVHFVVEASEPMGPVRVARTYFFSNGGAGARPLTFDYDGVETQEDNNLLVRGGRCAYARCLMSAYCAAMHVHRQLVAAYCRGDAMDEASLTALAVRLVEDLQLAWFRNYDVPKHLHVEICERDLEGNSRPPAWASRHAKYLKIGLHHISSLDQTAMDLGAVIFGETFLQPSVPGEQPLVVTQAIEPYCGWLGEGQEEDTEHTSALLSRLCFSNKNRHFSMGSLLSDAPVAGVRLLTGLDEMPSVRGDLWVFQRGLIFTSPRLGSIALDFAKHVSSLGYFNADFQAQEDTAAAVFKFEVKGSLARYGILEASPLALPPQAIVISSGDADRRYLSREVLSIWLAWFQDQNLECSPLDAFPSGFQDLEALSDRHWGDEPLFVNSMKQHNVQTYVNSLQKLDSTLHSAAAPDSCKLAQRARAANGCRVIVFFGEPGCDKFKLVQSAVQLAGLIPSWKIVRYHSEVSPVQIDSDKLADKVLEALPSDAIDAGIILVVSSFAPAMRVVAAVADNARLKSAVFLERMVAVVNATSILTPGNEAHEAVVSAQCATGLVSNIVLVNIEALGDQVDSISGRLRAINPFAPIIRAVAGRVTGTGDLESLFELRADQEPWFARDKECVIRDQLFTTSQLSATNHQRAIDPWASRRGKFTQAQFMLPSDVVFVRPQLVRAIRALFVSPRQSLGTWVDEKNGASMMEISHVKAIVRMVQSERPEDLEKISTYVVKAKRGTVTFTKCDAEEWSVTVSGRNLHAEKFVVGLFDGRRPIKEVLKQRGHKDLTADELAEIMKTSSKYPLPDGVFFNGSQYIDWSGETLKEHPRMDDMISDFLAKEWADVTSHNQSVQDMEQQYRKDLDSCIAIASQVLSNTS